MDNVISIKVGRYQALAEAFAAANPYKLPEPRVYGCDLYAQWKECSNKSSFDYEQCSIDLLRRMRKEAERQCDAQVGRGVHAARVWSGLDKIIETIAVRERG